MSHPEGSKECRVRLLSSNGAPGGPPIAVPTLISTQKVLYSYLNSYRHSLESILRENECVCSMCVVCVCVVCTTYGVCVWYVYIVFLHMYSVCICMYGVCVHMCSVCLWCVYDMYGICIVCYIWSICVYTVCVYSVYFLWCV